MQKMKMQKSTSHTNVIFPSTVRTIPFTVPRLPSSLSSSSSSPSSFSALLRSSPSDPRFCVRGSDLGSRRSQTLPMASVGQVRSSGTLSHFQSSQLTTAAAAAAAATTDQRWSSEPSFQPFQRLTEEEEEVEEEEVNAFATSTGLRRDEGSRATTVDLQDANLLFGIDPSLYLSTESGLDTGSTTGGWPETEDDTAEEDDDFYSGVYNQSNIGRVWFSLEYDPETEKLLVTLLNIRNLPTSFASNQNSRDPIVRIWLMPDERRWVQTKFKRTSRNHRFNENFSFQVSYRDFASRSIKLTLFGSSTDNRRSRRHQPFAYVIYPLKDHVTQPNERIVVWRDFEKESVSSQLTNGDTQLHLSLSYDGHSHRMNVALHSGKNFPPVEDDHQSDEFYVIVSQMEMNKVIKRKKTSIVRQIVNFSPIFNELFHFKVRSDRLENTSLLITVMRHNPGGKDEQIGRLVLGSFMFARGQELDHWNATLANEKQSVARWHTLTK